MGLAAYSYLLRQHGLNGDADYYDKFTREFTEYWLKNALVSHFSFHLLFYFWLCPWQEGDHYRREFHLRVTSWSLKYNLFYHVSVHSRTLHMLGSRM